MRSTGILILLPNLKIFDFFSKNLVFFSNRILHQNSDCFPVFKKIEFFEKITIFFKKALFSCDIKKCNYFVRIPRQSCYKLVMKNFQSQSRAIVQLTSKLKKNARGEKTIYFHIMNMGEHREEEICGKTTLLSEFCLSFPPTFQKKVTQS